MRPIFEVAEEIGIDHGHLIPYGISKAKVSLEAIRDRPAGNLIVVTGMTPTPAGEGKTTTSVALAQGMGKIGLNSAVTLRQPSLGPIFGLKGGGAGGGRARVVPEDEINVHFTGDGHAVSSAHNLLAALAENAIQRGQIPGVRTSGISWRRVLDIQDRALRNITTGLGGAGNAPLRETGFDIVPASEIMAVLALATDFDDLRRRLVRVTTATGQRRESVTAGGVGAVGSLMARLRHALLPNLVQTTEGQAAFVHTGPFGNIAHGCSSVVADRLALGYADFVLTEAGFGADLGFEKFMNIKCRGSGLNPSAAVVVATVRALRHHGGVARDRLAEPDLKAVETGTDNLAHMIGIVRGFGLPAVVAINRFASDTDAEIAAAREAALAAGASAAVESTGYACGGAGSADLAAAVAEAAGGPPPPVSYPYRLTDPIVDKVESLATKVYGAADVHWSPRASRQRRRFERQGLSDLPICMAKTPMSLSHDPRRRNRPSGYTFEVVDCRASTGAGFVYPIASSILTMPGLPRKPRTLDVDALGRIVGI